MTVSSKGQSAFADATVRAHLWIAGTLAALTGAFGAGLAAILAWLDLTTTFEFTRGPGVLTNEMGLPLTGFAYFWNQYGVWLFDGVITLAVLAALILAWRFILSRRTRLAWFFCIATCLLSALPFIVNAARGPVGLS